MADWHCFSRPEDDGHEYVCSSSGFNDDTLYKEDGVVIVFDREQVCAIQSGMHPREACRLRRRPPSELDAPKEVKRSGRRFEVKEEKPKPTRKRKSKGKE